MRSAAMAFHMAIPSAPGASRMRFLCDEMLSGLGRWLRAAGYDTLIAGQGVPARELIAQAVRDSRLLLTRDRKLAEFRDAAKTVLVLNGNGLDSSVTELMSRLPVAWDYRPFSRCMVCNTLLEQAASEMIERVPPASRAHVQQLYHCPGCDRVYWEGSHVRRMRARLAAWNSASDGPA